MANEPSAYIPRNPGDLISAADWNNLQTKIKEDIAKQIGEAIKNHTTIANSDNTHKVDGQTVEQLTDAIIEKAKQILPLQTGYRRVFKMLSKTSETIIEHKLAAYPVVDVYKFRGVRCHLLRRRHEDRAQSPFLPLPNRRTKDHDHGQK